MNKKLIEEFLKLVLEDIELISTDQAHRFSKNDAPVEIEKGDQYGGRVEKHPSRPQTIEQLRTAFLNILNKYSNDLPSLRNKIFGASYKEGDLTELGDDPKNMRKPVNYNTDIAQALFYLLKIWKLDRKMGSDYVSKLITLLNANQSDTKNISGWDNSLIRQSEGEISARELNPIEPYDVRNFLKLFEIHSDPQRAKATKSLTQESLIQEAFERHNLRKIIREIILNDF